MSGPSDDPWRAEDPDWPRKDWQYEVANNDTVLGYWDWVCVNRGFKIDEEGEDT